MSGQTQNDSASPNVHAALGHNLLAASDLVGRDSVVQFFRDRVGEIIKNHFPIDAGGLIRAKCEADVGALINSLMDNP